MNLSPINPTSPGFIDRFPVKKVALVTTILLLVLGIILIIGGSVGFMPLLPAVISGAILLGVVASVGGFQLVRHLTEKKKEDLEPKDLGEIPVAEKKKEDMELKDLGEIPEKITTTPKISGIQEIKGVKFNAELMKKADAWCKDELEKRRELPPEEEGYLYNEFLATSHGLHQEDEVGKICCEEYPEAFRLVCETGGNKRRALGVVIGCYPILIQSLIRRDLAISNLLSGNFATTVPESQKLPEQERLVYLLSSMGPSETALVGVDAGMIWLFRAYMMLRMGVMNEHSTNNVKGVDSQEFFTPGTDCYFARQIFNSAQKAFLSIIPLAELKKYSIKNEAMDFLYQACLIPDEGDEFLKIHKNYQCVGRGHIPVFCN